MSLPVPGRFEPRPELSWDELRAERLHEIRWWTLAEVEAAPPDLWFAPRRMPSLLRALAADGALRLLPARGRVDRGAGAVPAPAAGVLAEIHCQEGDLVQAEQVGYHDHRRDLRGKRRRLVAPILRVR